MIRSLLTRLTTLVIPVLCLGLVASCDDSTGPAPIGFVSITPVFAAPGAPEAVNVSRLHVVFTKLDGTIAKDTTFTIPLTALNGTSLILQVPMSRSSKETGQDFALEFDLQDASGTTFFHGGPIDVHASVDLAPAGTPINAVYVGPGAGAVRVEVTPGTRTINVGGTAEFTATAFNANNVVVPGALVIWSTANSAVATFQNPAVGTATAGSARGTTQVRASLVTGQTGEATLIVQPPATAIAAQSGNNQSIAVNTVTQPLVVKVTAADGQGVVGIPVTFSLESGAGGLSGTSATTDANGVAQVTYTAPAAPENAIIRATSTGLAGSPVNFNVSVVAGAATNLAFLVQPTNREAGTNFSPAIQVEARDAFGNRATGFNGVVTLSLEGGVQALGGTASVAAVGGVATFNALNVVSSGTDLRLRATATGVPNTALSNAFAISSAVATQLVIVSAPTVGGAGQLLEMVVEARTASNALATEFVGGVGVSILSGPSGAAFVIGSTTAPFSGGRATLSFGVNNLGEYEFLVTAPGLPQKIVGPVQIGDVRIEVVSGNNQSGVAGSTLPLPLTVRVTNSGGVAAPGVPVTWDVTTGGGIVVPISAVTDVNGLASATWILGATGFQSVQAGIGGIGGQTVSFSASAFSPPPLGPSSRPSK